MHVLSSPFHSGRALFFFLTIKKPKATTFKEKGCFYKKEANNILFFEFI